MVNPIAQKWEKRRAPHCLSPVTVLLNPTQRSAMDRFKAEDTGVGKRLTDEMVLHRALNDYLGLNVRESFLRVGSGGNPRIDDTRWE